MNKLSKKFVLALGLVLVVKSLFAIEIVNLNNNSNIEPTKLIQKCTIENESSDYKKVFIEKYEVYFTTPYPMYFDKGFIVNDKVYIFDKDVKNPIEKMDYTFCNTIKNKNSIKLSKELTSLMFEYYKLNKQIVQLPKYLIKFERNPFVIKSVDKKSLIKLNHSITKAIRVYR
ncbi:hypothetical protein L5F68_08240 [Aliarcobacter butzleri]|uniref:hypothetical protein n=1 Tax=Aliarcobacter butzleri TaxID=28197 RepID=UPI001EE06782|nr:hypothetical protein [Aliarcobacter butzleri]MCG3704321.1 hypothetical protein [Aliarcobacter butzleri]